MVDTALATGGTGFLGGWCMPALLGQGYNVRTTVRDLARARDAHAATRAAGADPDGRLEVFAPDLNSDHGWPEAAAGCRYAMHVASPFPPVQPKNPDELIVPARDGALRVALSIAQQQTQPRILEGAAVASVLSGAPSVATTLARGSARSAVDYAIAATRAVGTIAPSGRPGFVRGAAIHGVISIVAGELL
jgi:nucleoside-diphosphate-sugar epimerase